MRGFVRVAVLAINFAGWLMETSSEAMNEMIIHKKAVLLVQDVI
ncbi:hypothetical protein SAMN02982927_02663 [Sporolactobacillus nakayamae]|uniref:Uncharacterized protein n=1 Tax=Sporolactobacillus nakayamae TaxID=269670 RepID=A0A1I2UDW9_9BACL|nr:hypothetical protein SAMN02982927_02663 [Sporolactobacillus nakayamae]